MRNISGNFVTISSKITILDWGFYMKKLVAFLLSSVCVLGLSGCQKEIKGSELYSFPEPPIQITGSLYSQGQETKFEIGSEKYDPNDLSTISVISWFYDLELIACDKPEAAEVA